jgi:hypothetical protein
MKKALIILSIAAITAISFADTFPGTTTPQNSDRDTQSLWRINRLLYEAANGTTPFQVATSGTSTTTATVSGTNLTTSGTLAAGARSVVFISSGNFTGSIATAVVPASTSQTLRAPDGMTLSAIPYTVTSGTLGVLKTQ